MIKVLCNEALLRLGHNLFLNGIRSELEIVTLLGRVFYAILVRSLSSIEILTNDRRSASRVKYLFVIFEI